MANMKDLNRFVKKGQVKAKKVPVKAGSWLANAMKSVGLSARDTIQEIMPNSIELASSAVETTGEVVDALRDMKGQRGKLKQAFDANVYTKLAKEGLKNALEDLKTGDFYNKKRFEQYTSDYLDNADDGFDFGGGGGSSSDDDFDFDFDDDFGDEDFDADITSDDGEATATIKKSSKGKKELTQISMSNNIGPDSPLVQSINFSSQVTAKATGVIVDTNNANARALVTLMGNNSMASLKALTQVNDSIVSINDNLSELISKHNAVAEQYYSDSMDALNKIVESVQNIQNNTMATVLANSPKDPASAVNLLDMFNGAVLDRSAYTAYLKKNITRFSEENIFISQIKSALEQTDALGSIMAAPLRFITEDISKQLIPKVVQASMSKFDDMLGEFTVGLLTKIGSWQDNSNPILDAVGKIFGVNNKMNTRVDKATYEKGAVPFDGITHRTINDVIPTYLRQITAALTGKEEFAFDYNKGTYRTIRDIQNEKKRDDEYLRTSVYNDYINNFNNVLDKMVSFPTTQDRDNQRANFVHLLDSLTKKGGVSSFRISTNKEGEVYDPLIEELGTDPRTAQLFRAWAEGHVGMGNRGYITRLLSRLPQQAKADVSDQTNRRNANPIAFNDQYLDNGLGQFDNSGIIFGNADKKVEDRYAEVSGVIDVDKYGHKPTYYLREIYRTLLNGIGTYSIGRPMYSDGVSPSGPSDTSHKSSGGIMSRVKSIFGIHPKQSETPKGEPATAAQVSANETININALKRSDTEADKTDKRYRAKTTKNSKYEKDIKAGKQDADQTYNDEQTNAAAAIAVQQVADEDQEEDRKASIFEILAGGDNTLAKWAREFNKGVGGVSKALQTGLDAGSELMFNIIFGNEDGKKGFGAITDFLISGMKVQFRKLFNFVDDKVLKPIDNALFGDNGIFTKIKESELFKSISDKYKAGKDAISSAIFGEKITNPDGTVTRQGGIFGDVGKNITNSVNNALGINPDDKGKRPENFNDLVKYGAEAVWKNTKNRFNEWTDMLLGPPSDDSHKNKARDFVDGFRAEIKGKGGEIGAGAVLGAVGAPIFSSSVGALGSIFLPGGPIGGAILGAGISFVNQSDTLKNWLFGAKDPNGERSGGVVSKDLQTFFKDHAKGIKIGAGVGALSGLGFLPWLWLPGGPIGGAILGAGISMANRSGAFDRFLYGEGGTKDDPTGGIVKKFKEIFGKDKNLKQLGLDAATGAGVGLVGSFFLPGGPITGALIGSAISIGVNTEKFKTLMFGDEEVDENGNKTGKRKGGLFGKFTGFLKDKIFDPLAQTASVAQAQFLHFMETKVALPLQVAVAPITNKFKEFGETFMDGFKNMFKSIKDKFQETVTKPIGDSINKWLIKPIKNLAGSIFKGLFSIIGGIISAPFAAIGGIGQGIFESDKRRGARAASEDQLRFGFANARDAIKERGLRRGAGLALLNIRSGIKGALSKDIRNRGAFSERGAGAYASEEENPDTIRMKLQAEADARYTERLMKLGLKVPKGRAKLFGRKGTVASEGPEDVPVEDKPRAQVMGILGTVKPDTPKEETVKDISDNTSNILDLLRKFVSDARDKVAGAGDNIRNKFKKNDADAEISVEPTRAKVFGILGSQTNSDAPVASGDIKGSTSYKPADAEVVTPSSSSTVTTRSSRSIADDVRDIADSVHGQLNGVGSNVNKIYRVLLKKNGLNDDDIKGDNNKEYMGFFGKLRTALNRPLKSAVDFVLAPFRAIGNILSGIKDTLFTTAKSLFDGAGELVKGFAKAGLSLLEIPVNITRIGLELAKSLGPAFGQFLWQGVKLAGNALNGAVKLAGNAINGIAETIAGAAHGLGEAIGGAISAVVTLGKGLGVLTKDVLGGLWTVLKGIGGGLWDIGKTIVGGAIKGGMNLVGGLASLISGKFEVNGTFGLVLPVYVVGGVLDKVKKIESGTVRVEGGWLDYVSENRSVTFSKETQKHHDDILNAINNIANILNNGPRPTSPLAGGPGPNPTAPDGGLQLPAVIPQRQQMFGTLGQDEPTKSSDVIRLGKSSYRMDLGLFANNHQLQVVNGSANAIKARQAESDKETNHEQTQLAIIDTLKGQFKQDKKQNIEWGKVFSLKNGIITLGAIALVNWLTKGGLAKVVGNALSSAFNLLPSIIGSAIKGFTNLGDKTRNKELVVDPETGLPVTDENGNAKVVDRTDSIFDTLNPTESYVDTETGEVKTDRRWRPTSTALKNIAVTRVKNFLNKGVNEATVKVVSQKAMTKSSKLTEGFFKLCSKAMSLAKDKVGAFILKHGGSAGNKIVKFFSTIDGALSKAATNSGIIDRFKTRITQSIAKMTGKSTAAVVSFGVTEGLNVLGGAIDANPAQVFHVNAKDVNLTMQLVARLVRGLFSTTAGSILDLGFQIAGAVLGRDLVSDLAVTIYNIISGEDKQDDLREAQENFNKEWQAYQKDEYNAYLKKCETEGQQPMSEEEFMSSVATSEQSYNERQNKTVTAAVVDTAVNGARSIKNFFTGNKTGASKQGINAYNTYMNQGSNDETNASGDDGGQGATVVLDKDRLNNFPFLLQNDSRWGSQQYTSTGDASQTIGSSGCGTTSMAMILRSFGNNVTPVDTSSYSLQNGYRTANAGTGWGFFRSIGNQYGLTTEDLGKDTNAVAASLAAGKPIIASMGKGTFTKSGHFIVLSGTDSNGNILVNDPASTERSQKAWPLSVFANEGKNFWAFSKDGSGSIGNTAPVDAILSTSNGSYSSNVDSSNMQGETSTSSGSGKKSFTQLLSEFASAIFKPIGDALGISFGDDSSSDSSNVNFNDATSTTDANGNTINYTVDGDYVGKYVKQFESGSKGSAMISSGKGDYGGVSFGSYQFPTYGQAQASSSSNLAKFWNQYYGSQYSSTPGNNDAFKKDWTTAVEKDPAGFFNNEHKFVADLYYNPFVSKLKSAGVGDPGNNSRGAQDAAWSTAVQLGAGTSAVNKFIDAGVNESTDPETYLKKLYEQKISTVPQTFKSSSKSVQQSVADRYKNELNVLLPLAKEKGINPDVVGKGETEVNGKEVTPTQMAIPTKDSNGNFTDNIQQYSSEPNASGPMARVNYNSVRYPSYHETNAAGTTSSSGTSVDLMNQVVTLLTTIANEITNISETVEGINKKPSSIGYIDNSVTNNNTQAATQSTTPTKTYTQSAKNGRDRSGYEMAKRIAKGTFALA